MGTNGFTLRASMKTFLCLALVLPLSACIIENDCCCVTSEPSKYPPTLARWDRPPFKGCGSAAEHSCTSPVGSGCGDNFAANRSRATTTPVLKMRTTTTNSSPIVTRATTPTANYRNSCQVECAQGSESPFCLVLNKKNTGAIFNQMTQLSELFKAKESIEKKKVMDIFSVTDDPCLRSNIDLRDNSLTNSGTPCTFSAEIEIGPVSKRIFEISMPETLTGNVFVGEKISIEFPDKDTSPMIAIDDYLNKDFGGYIMSVLTSEKEIIIGSESGCIALR